MSGLRVRRVDRAGKTVLFLEGGLDEFTTLSWANFPDLAPKVYINLKGLDRINSCGVREWLHLVNTRPNGTQLYYQQASAVFAAQAEQIANFLGSGQLVSFFALLSCDYCSLDNEHLFNMEQLRSEGYTAERCIECGRDMAIELPNLTPKRLMEWARTCGG